MFGVKIMIAISLPRRRIVFTSGIIDATKKKLIFNTWMARPFISENFPLPNFKKHKKEDDPENHKLADIIYF